MGEAEIGKALGEAVKRAIARSTLLVYEDAVARCPVDKSGLKDSIDFDKEAGEVFARAKHAPIVEYGLGGKIIVPKNEKVLAWTKKGTVRPDSNDGPAWKALAKRGLAIFAKKSKGIETIGTGQDGKGLTKVSFLRPALWQNKEEILNIFKEEIKVVGAK